MIRTWMIAACVALSGCQPAAQRDSLYQVSLNDALLAGEYDGVKTIGDVRRHGDLGLGTFDRLDGEMIVLDGVVYQAKADGRVLVARDDQTTPFAAVAWFKPEFRVSIRQADTMESLGRQIDAALPGVNWFYALRIDGTFDRITIRSIPPQRPPYPPVTELAEQFVVWELRDVAGTLVGLRSPAYSKGINMPGHHWHFISDDRSAGGHVEALRLKDVEVQVDRLTRWIVDLPDDEGFARVNLSVDRSADLEKIKK